MSEGGGAGDPGPQGRLEVIAIAISVFALFVSAVGIFYQDKELQAQEQALDNQRDEVKTQIRSLRQDARQFDASGPALRLSGDVVPRNESTAEFSDDRWASGQAISAEWVDQVVAEQWTIWVEATVTNFGLAPGPMTAVGSESRTNLWAIGR